jgi:hypothetical protein
MKPTNRTLDVGRVLMLLATLAYVGVLGWMLWWL